MFKPLYERYILNGRGDLPPPGLFQKDYEALAFFMLFPYGVGHWSGPARDANSIDDYVQCRLRVADARWRKSLNWLLWALTMVTTEKSRYMISFALWAMHDQIKARHVGIGLVQIQIELEEAWESVRVVGDKLELV